MHEQHQPPSPGASEPGRQRAASVFATSAASVVEVFATTEGLDGFAVSRMTERWWTPVAADRRHRDAMVERPLPVDSTICHHLLVDDLPVHVSDMARQLPAVQAIGRRYGTTTYVTAPLRRPGGRLLGSVCGWSTGATGRQDPAGLLRRLATAAEHLTGQLVTALDAVAEDRRADVGRALGTADPVTGLPDRRGWALLLQAEEERSRQLATPVSVVAVDTGLVRTARGIRRAGDLVREAAGDLPVSRVSGRRFAVLASDVDDPVALAAAVCAEMVIAGYRGAVGWATREPPEGLSGTWARAEGAVQRSLGGPAQDV